MSPMNGNIIELSEVNDATFSEKLLGDGVAIESEDGKVFAPFDGIVSALFPTNHAISLESDDGVEMLIHIGIDTVQLNGKYFFSHVEQNQKIKQGDLLIEFNKEAIKSEGYAIITPVIIANTDTYSNIIKMTNNKVTKEEVLLSIQA